MHLIPFGSFEISSYIFSDAWSEVAAALPSKSAPSSKNIRVFDKYKRKAG